MITINKTKTKETTKQTFPIFGIAFLILLLFKLTGHTTLSWWWITAPLWGPLTIFLGIFTLAAIVLGITTVAIALLENYQDRKRKNTDVIPARFLTGKKHFLRHKHPGKPYHS